MNFQNIFPKNERKAHDVSDLFHPVGDDSFFINSYCIQAPDQIITKGQTYLLFNESEQEDLKISPVKLLLVVQADNKIQLVVKDLMTQKQALLNHILDDGKALCDWILVDLDFLQEKLDRFTVCSYCTKN